MKNGQNVGKHRLQVVNDISELRQDAGLCEEDLTRAPEALEDGLDLVADGLLLPRRPHLVLALDEQEVELAVVPEDGGPLGLGRVRGQNGLDTDLGEALRRLPVRNALGGQPPESVSPEAGLPRQTGCALSPAPPLVGGVLLGHVEKLKRDRIRLGEPLRRLVPAQGPRLFRQGKSGGDLSLAQLQENLLETTEEEFVVDFRLLEIRALVLHRRLFVTVESSVAGILSKSRVFRNGKGRFS